MILIADSRLQCRQTLGLVWSNELLMGGNSHAPSPHQQSQQYNSTLAWVLALCNDHTHRTPGLPAHFINIKPEKQDKNAQIAPDACPVMKTEKCGPTFKAEFNLVAKQLKLIFFCIFRI